MKTNGQQFSLILVLLTLNPEINLNRHPRVNAICRPINSYYSRQSNFRLFLAKTNRRFLFLSLMNMTFKSRILKGVISSRMVPLKNHHLKSMRLRSETNGHYLLPFSELDIESRKLK